MFSQFGETDQDIDYIDQVLNENLVYAQSMLGQEISDYEKERWQADTGQSLGIVTLNQPMPDIEIGQWQTEYAAQLAGTESTDVLTAGFDLSSNWPMLAILGIGILVASRKGNGKKKGLKRKKRRSK